MFIARSFSAPSTRPSVRAAKIGDMTPAKMEAPRDILTAAVTEADSPTNAVLACGEISKVQLLPGAPVYPALQLQFVTSMLFGDEKLFSGHIWQIFAAAGE